MSWKSYGGTNKTDNLQNISIGTLVADTILLRQNYATELTVQGSMQILGGITVNGNSTFLNNTINKEDVFADKDLYINNKLYFGKKSDTGKAGAGYSFISGGSTLIGINTQSPSTSFDITDINNNDNVLTVRSQTNINRNVIAENINNHGIISYVKDDIYASISSLQFFNKSIIVNQLSNSNTNQTADSIIQHKWLSNNTGILSLQGNNIRIDSSCVLISPRGYSDTITNYFNESALIYDNLSTPYLYNCYNKKYALSGNALSLISSDNSSNTFLNITSPNKYGLAIGGGAFPNDDARAFGTIGLNLQNNYYPIQTMVSSTNNIYYKSTIGINTYAPKTENYILDINGPTRINNGEITQTFQTTYEATNMCFSKRNGNFGILCGSPVTTNPPFYLKTNTTIDGGKTWLNNVDIETQGALINTQNNPTYMSIFVYDSSYAIIGCSTNSISALYYTCTGGLVNNDIKAWNKLIDSNSASYKSYKTIYIADSINTNKRVFLTGITNTYNIYASYFDISFGESLVGSTSSYTSIAITDLSINTITCCDGHDNILYYAGTGIQKYNIATATSMQIIRKTNILYNKIYAYDASYVIAIGDNIISYTKNGQDWTDISIKEDGSPVGTLNNVYIYDLSHGLIVGNSGTFLYTKNGALSWSTVPNDILNSSGIASRINDTSNNLVSINMPNINSFIICDTSQSYMPINNQQGISKIIYGFFPNLFNHTNNTVFEVSGNMIISGDININDGGKLNTNNDTFYLFNENVGTLNIGSQTTTSHFNGNVFINNDTSLNGNLFVNKKTILDDDVSANAKFYISGDISANAKLYVAGDVSLNSKLYVANDVSANSKLYVAGDVSLNSKLYVANDISANAKLYVAGNVSLGNQLSITNDVSANAKLYVAGNVSLGSQLFIANDVSANAKLYVAGNVSLNSKLYVAGDISANSKLYVGGDASLNGQLYVNYDATINSLTIGKGNSYIATNTAIGYKALTNNSTGNTNIGLGYQPLYNNTTGSSNIGIGYKALYSITSDSSNTALGNEALYNNNGGSYNTAVGQSAGKLNTTGSYNTFIGYNTSNSGAFSYSTAIGNNATIYGSNQILLGTINDKVITAGDASFNNRLYVNGDVSLNSHLHVANTVTAAGAMYVNNGFYSNYIESTTGGRLYIGTQANNTSTIVIGSLDVYTNSINTTTKTIYIGGKGDTVILSGDVQNKTVTDLIVNSNQIILNEGAVGAGQSYHSGILFHDNDTDQAGYFWVSLDMSGFVFQATNPNSNRLKLDTNALVLDSNTTTGLLVLKKSTELSDSDSDYRITVQNIDINSLLIRDKTNSTSETQFISSNLTLSSGDLSLNKNIFLNGDASLNSKLYVSGDISANSNIYIGGDASLNSKLYVVGDISANSRLYVGGDLSLNSKLYVVGDISANSNAYVGGDVSFNNKLYISGDISANSNACVGGDASLNSKLYVASDISANSNAYIGGDVSLNSNLYVAYDISMNAYLYVGGDVSLNSKLYVAYDISANSNAYVGGDVSFNNKLYVAGDISANSRLYVGSDTSLNSKLYVAGDISANSNLYVGGDVSLNSNLYIAGDISANSNIYVGGDVSLNRSLYVVGDISANSNIYVGGDVSLNSSLYVVGDISANSRLFIGGDVSLGGLLYVIADVSINSNLLVGGDVSLNSKLHVVDDISANSCLFLGSDASLNGNVFIAKNTTMNGNTYIGGSNGLTVSGGIIKAMDGLAIGVSQLEPNTTLDVSGSIFQTNGVIFQF